MLICVVLVIAVIGYILVAVYAPYDAYGDVFEYFTFTNTVIDDQSLDNISQITGVTLGDSKPVYQYTPLLFVQTAALQRLTGASIPLIYVIINIIKLLTLAALVFTLVKKMFNSSWPAFWSMVFVLFGPLIPYYSHLLTRNFTWLFLLAYLLIFQSRRIGSSLRLVLLIMILFALMLYHHETGLLFSSLLIVFSSFEWLIQYRQKIISKVRVTVNIFLTVATPITVILFSRGYLASLIHARGLIQVKAEVLKANEFISQNIGWVPIIIIAFGLISWFWIKIHRAELSRFLIWFLLLSLLGFPLSGSWVSMRLIEQFQLLAMILGGGAVVWLMLMVRKKVIQNLVSGLILIMALALFGQTIDDRIKNSQVSWDYLSNLEEIKPLLQNQKVLSDPFTLFRIQGLTGAVPAYQFRRPKDDYSQIKELASVFKEENPELAKKYLIDNEIEYVVINSEFTPVWGGSELMKFDDPINYQLLVEFPAVGNELLSVYQVNNNP